MNRDELAARLLETFIAELEDQVAMLDRHLLVLESKPEQTEDRRAVFRIVHTLKGAARAAGVGTVEATCHRLETLLAQVRDETRPLDAGALSVLFQGASELSEIAIQLRAGHPGRVADTQASPPAHEDAGERRALTRPNTEDTSHSGTIRAEDSSTDTGDSASTSSDPTQIAADVRVRAEQLYTLLGASSRLLMSSARVANVHHELESLRGTLNAVTLRHADAVSTSSSNSLHDSVREIQESLRTLVRDVTRLTIESAETFRQLSVVTSDVNLGVRALRLRPFSDAVAMLPRLLRDAAAETGKEVQLEINGNEIEADRTVLDEMREAILHLARNAVAHGIETPERRTALGKPATGTVRVSARVVVDHIVVTVEDDGAGIDVPAIRAVLERQGEVPPADAAALVRRLFEGGVSTRDTADSISGRGVGLDVVRAAMARIRGTFDVSWRPGSGTIFTLEAPVALATLRAVLVNVGTHVIAIPDAYINRLIRLASDAIRVADGRSVIPLGDVPIPLVSLARLLGPPMTERAIQDNVEVVIVSNGTRRIGLVVDQLVGEDEIVIRPVLSKGKRELPFISGAALLRSGKVALVANVGALIAAGFGDSAGVASPLPHVSKAPTRSRILIADDSITTRTLEQSVLEMAGYEVITAVDGADAWRLLQERGADLVVSDVEMPRMDGFTLCRNIRSSSRFRELPVVLVTALESQEDRERGIEAGADAYLAKSSFDQETLLDTIRQLIG